MFAASAPEFSANRNEQPRRAWKPDGNDHLIFNWVKLKGHSQDWVATQLGISQSTVSRIVQRYERWQAHAKEREGGRLDHAERLRAQRWLTYERNEALLATCLRIATEMEGFTDVSKSTIRRGSSPSEEREVSTQHSVVDRSGIAARFLRLAFRINMEQLKLCELDPPPPADPLSDDELADELSDAAAAAAELRKLWPAAEEAAAAHDSRVHERSEMHHSADDDPDQDRRVHEHSEMHHSASDAHQPQPAMHPLHNLHNDNVPQIAATAAAPCSCESQAALKRISRRRIKNPASPQPLVIRITPDAPLPCRSNLGNTAMRDELREPESPGSTVLLRQNQASPAAVQ